MFKAKKTTARLGALILLAAAILTLGTPNGHAQQTLELAPPAPQRQPPIATRPSPHARPPAEPPPPSRQLQVIPPAATPAPPPARLSRQPVLPAVFHGCWDGRVRYLDSIHRLYGAPKVGPWTPKTYRICYRRVGNGPFQLTFSDAGVEHNPKIINPSGRMELISTDGRDTARMRALLHFDEYYSGLYFRGHTFSVDEEAILDCVIQSNGSMTVRGRVFGTRDGSPWFRATWHAIFSKIESLPE